MKLRCKRDKFLGYMERDRIKNEMGHREGEESNVRIGGHFLSVVMMVFDVVSKASMLESKIRFDLAHKSGVKSFPSGRTPVITPISKRVGVTIPYAK